MNVLEVEGLCKRYPAFALENVSFSVGAGRICGFIGRNGAGKSTTLGSLTGLVHPRARRGSSGWTRGRTKPPSREGSGTLPAA